MKRQLLRLVLPMLLMGIGTIGLRAEIITDTIFNRQAHEQDFAFGADIGFVSQMESWGTKWLDKDGKQKDILQILKEQGINNVRLRVWVNPSGGWCGKSDVVNMAKRAHAKGMGIMLSFHYSDSWADPGTQDRPAAWKDHTVEQLEQDVYNHTKDIITALQAVGITPRWAQIGNETKRGMFYPTCQTNKGGTDNFALMLKAGIRACKECDESIQTIIHLPDGHDNSLYRSMFDALKSRGVKWDMIGMSAYPRWSHLDGPTMLTKVMANIKDLKQRYGTPVMVVETGHYWYEPIVANNYLVDLMDNLIKDGDPGTFYWEPESMAGYDLGAWDQDTKRPTAAMDAFLGVKHSEVDWIIKAAVKAPKKEQTVETGADVTLEASVLHVRRRPVSLEFYLDKKRVGKLDATPYEVPVSDLSVGVHSVWCKASDADKHTLTTDTVTFFVGQSARFDAGQRENAEARGGTQQWNIFFAQPGRYLLAFCYDAQKMTGTDVVLGTDSLARFYFPKGQHAYLSKEVEIAQGGIKQLTLTASSAYGLPAIASLRIFPLDGQALPATEAPSGMSKRVETGDELVDIYTLSGVKVGSATQRQLGISLGARSAAVVVLPNCVGGTPNIVRKQRLK